MEQRFYDVEIDELNEPHVTRHGISVAEIYEVLRNDPVVRRNRRGRAAGYLAFGVSDVGRAIVVAFAYDGRTARPIAAWEEER